MSVGISLILLISACSPTFNWRQVQGNDAPFSVLLPSKPSTFSRSVDLDGIKLNMTMTATEVDGIVFAVGSAKLNDVNQATSAIQAMKIALVKNINGSVKSESASAVSGGPQGNVSKIDIEALGPPENNGQPKVLFAHLEAKGQYIYQVIVIGPQKAVSTESVETFMQSFKAS
ncbi:hypothetical protein QN379_01400 [Glaciimonas sp. Gout2]|uniref:hypothetical protein n=1 Tax=unclassified Glaciimonas TaxID=2644401 RepID=UPI002B229778|nr:MULTISPECIES: hypothetical protein [unclassified Glaciimonas]MEB0011773.1 hypothetical protein [Glaciimonas sp. Cout2]MEB0080671.1 hypothetical protein [Glaciimonas sp. Gout2]